MNSERIGPMFDRIPELRALTAEAKRLLALQKLLPEILPGPLAAQTALVKSRTDELVLLADNGASANKLRQLVPRMLEFFRRRGFEVTGIRVQVQVTFPDKPLPQKRILLGPVAREAISRLSDRLPPSPLKAAMEKLSASGNPSNDDQGPLQDKQS